MMIRRRGWFGSLAMVGVLALAVAGGCSSETKDKLKDSAKSVQTDLSSGVDDAKSDVSSEVDKAKARATAEAIRASLKGNSSADSDGVRSVAVLQQVVDDLPGDVTVTGIADANGDGVDDDGMLQVDQDGQSACITLPASGEDIDVTSGACGS